MDFPKDKQIFEGEIASYWLEDDGILVSVSKNPMRTIANLTENIKLVKQITNNRIPPLLIYLSNSPVPDKATRKFASEQLPNLYKAMAMVSKPGLAKFIMNILFRFKPPPIPMKSFDNDVDAREWLKHYV
ncbi:MAG: STAS/SEC14 domain-containing protein [Bacteroidetes bacterium]|nr:MAG: STAS/SEC14 domain-containing protein [Bacteroidota bacterium]